MIIIGKIDWYGDRKARREGRDGDYGYISSLDNEIKGSFKLYGNNLKYDGEQDEFRDEMVTFYPDTSRRFPKARNVYFLGEHPDKSELKEALIRYETDSRIYSIMVELVKKSDEPVEAQVSVLLPFFNKSDLDADLILPLIKNDDKVLLTPDDAFVLFNYLSDNGKVTEEIINILKPVIISDTEGFLENFSGLSNTEKKRFVCLMPDNFLIENPQCKEYGTEKQIQVLTEHLEEAKRIANVSRLKQIAERRGIKYFVHFTRVENLPSILEHGLLTRHELAENNYDFLYSDEARYDGIMNSISLSVTFPNYKMLYSKKCGNAEAKWCVLILKAEEVLNLPCIFNKMNAASSESTYTPVDSRKSPKAFEEMFAETVGECERRRLKCYGKFECEKYATDPQAEILCLETIPVKAIYGCTFDELDAVNPYFDMLNNAGIVIKEHTWKKDNGPYKYYKASPKKEPIRLYQNPYESYPF